MFAAHAIGVGKSSRIDRCIEKRARGQFHDTNRAPMASNHTRQTRTSLLRRQTWLAFAGHDSGGTSIAPRPGAGLGFTVLRLACARALLCHTLPARNTQPIVSIARLVFRSRLFTFSARANAILNIRHPSRTAPPLAAPPEAMQLIR